MPARRRTPEEHLKRDPGGRPRARRPGEASSSQRVLELQRLAGNQAVSALLRVQRLVVQRDVGSDDYNQGYQDGVSGRDANPVPRDGDALTDYNEGYARGQYEFGQQNQSGGGPNSSQGPAMSPAPPSPAPEPGPNQSTAEGADWDAYNKGVEDGRLGRPDDAIGRVGFAHAQDYETGYAEGKRQASAPPPAAPELEPPSDMPEYRAPTPEQEEGEGPEKPDELPAYQGPEWHQYIRLRDKIRTWRLYLQLKDWEDAKRYELSEGEHDLYQELWAKFQQYDDDTEPPPPREDPEFEEEEEEAREAVE